MKRYLATIVPPGAGVGTKNGIGTKTSALIAGRITWTSWRGEKAHSLTMLKRGVGACARLQVETSPEGEPVMAVDAGELVRLSSSGTIVDLPGSYGPSEFLRVINGNFLRLPCPVKVAAETNSERNLLPAIGLLESFRLMSRVFVTTKYETATLHCARLEAPRKAKQPASSNLAPIRMFTAGFGNVVRQLTVDDNAARRVLKSCGLGSRDSHIAVIVEPKRWEWNGSPESPPKFNESAVFDEIAANPPKDFACA